MPKLKEQLGEAFHISPKVRAMPKVKPYPHEIWKEYIFEVNEGDERKRRYAYSNFGRFGSFTKSISEDLLLIKEVIVLGYKVSRIWYKVLDPKTGKMKGFSKSVSIHKALAELFIPKKSPDQNFIIHKDYDKLNNDLNNLAWVTQEELTAHAIKNPAYIASVAKGKGRGSKLTLGQVIQIKKLLAEKKTRHRLIALKFKVSASTIDYIKRGLRWGHVKI